MKCGVVGATGAVGEELVKVLGRRRARLGLDAPVRLFASARSAGKTLESVWGTLTVETFALELMDDLDVVFLAVSGDFATKFAREIAARGPVVIDNSSAWRYDPNVPLVVPEINAHAARGAKLIANPNCTTAVAAMALWPLHQRFGIRKVIMSTYQAASGAGVEGMAELETQARDFAAGKPLQKAVFQHPLLFNVIPHVDKFQDNAYTKEEMKVTWETRKIFGCPDLDVSCTAVRIPTLRAHAEAITIQTFERADPAEARSLIAAAPGVELVDRPEENAYPMPLNASTKEDVEAGRVRSSLVFGDYGLDLFVCGDQLLRGAALNAVLIAESLHEGLPERPPQPFQPSLAARARAIQVPLPAALAGAAAAAALAALVVTRAGAASN